MRLKSFTRKIVLPLMMAEPFSGWMDAYRQSYIN
jgi:hypothetical protein